VLKCGIIDKDGRSTAFLFGPIFLKLSDDQQHACKSFITNNTQIGA